MEILVRESSRETLEETIAQMRLFCDFCGYTIEKIECIPTVGWERWLIVFHGLYPSLLRCADGKWVEDVWTQDFEDVVRYMKNETAFLKPGWRIRLGEDCIIAEYFPVIASNVVVPIIMLRNHDNAIQTGRRIS